MLNNYSRVMFVQYINMPMGFRQGLLTPIPTFPFDRLRGQAKFREMKNP